MSAQITFIKEAPQGLRAQPTGTPAVGILGGLFNPITCVHLELGLAAMRDFALGEVLYVLPQAPPHKTFFGASLEDRLTMMQLALTPYDRFSIGLSSHGLFIDIGRAALAIYPEGTHIYCIMGSDAAERILTWPYPDREGTLRDMFSCFELIVADRGQAFRLPTDPLVQAYSHKIHKQALPGDFHEHSSTRVRERVRQGLDIRDLAPDAVRAFIETRGLYRQKG